jgi:hypothetical protein
VGIKVEHGLKKGIFASGLLFPKKERKNHQGFQTFLSKNNTDI